MLRNYFILKRFVSENSDLFKNSTITSIFSQEKDQAVLVLKDKSGFLFFTEISVNPAKAYITIRSDFRRAKKNSIDFFTEFLPAEVTGISIAEIDRVISIKTDRFNLFFTIRGKYTNLHLITTEGEIQSFKKTAEENPGELIKELSSLKYTSDLTIPVFDIPENSDFDSFLKKNLPVTGKEIRIELKRRFEAGKNSLNELLNEILRETLQEKICVFYNSSSGEIKLAPSTFSLIDYTDKKQFGKLSEAINFYLAKSRFLENTLGKKNLVLKYIDKELTKLSSKINALRERINRGSKEEEYNRTGSLILINLHLIKPGMESIELDDNFTGGKINVKLDKKLTPQKNAEMYFNKAKSERTGFSKSAELLNQSLDRYNFLLKTKKDVEDNPDANINTIMNELNLKKDGIKSKKEDLKSSFRKYIIENKYRLFAGKDSKSNDLLTTKFAGQNDYWFHARGASGSHVVLQVENLKEGIPKSVLKKAASIAAYHSKAKTSGLVPVAYTLKKYVVKKKGDPSGTVRLLREDVLLVKPEIPADCEYVSD
ncbi:MAG: NFACT family protein [Marinilabiliales bacterium]